MTQVVALFPICVAESRVETPLQPVTYLLKVTAGGVRTTPLLVFQ